MITKASTSEAYCWGNKCVLPEPYLHFWVENKDCKAVGLPPLMSYEAA